MYQSKGNLLLNPVDQLFSSMHLNSVPVNSPQGVILRQLSRKRRSSQKRYNIRNGKLENKTLKRVCFLFFVFLKEKKKYCIPMALTTNSAQFAYILCVLLVCYSLTKMHSYHSSCLFIFPDGLGVCGGGGGCNRGRRNNPNRREKQQRKRAGTQKERKETEKGERKRRREEKRTPRKLLVLKPSKQTNKKYIRM